MKKLMLTLAISMMFAPVAYAAEPATTASTLPPFGKDKPMAIIHHGGQQEGGASFLVIAPAIGVSVAVMTNSGTSAARQAVQNTAYELVRQLNGNYN